MYTQSKGLPDPSKLVCPECSSNRFRVNYKEVVCQNCGWKESRGGGNKYGAKRTEARDGVKRDSKYEASVADELYMRKQAGDILGYDSQYKIEAWACRSDGTPAFKVSHKVDFRIHNLDGSYTLCEAKGVETSDYLWRRKFLEFIWLPDHPDHTYRVVKQSHR